MSSPAVIIFRKEMRDALRSRLVLLLILGLGVIAVVSVIVGAAAYHTKVLDYETYLHALQQAGGTPPAAPLFFPLQLLRGAIEYLEVIGAIIAIVLGYGIVAKEKNRGTLRLLVSRPVSDTAVAVGKLMALAAIWLTVVAALGVVMVVSIRLVGGTLLTSSELTRLAISLGFAWLYLFLWSALAMGLAGFFRQLSSALVVSLIVWLVIVLIIPQIGDTMDPDNQVPGGLFATLKVDKPHEKAVMAHFVTYETARDTLEETSISKRFERASFAFLGIKDRYNQRSLGYIGTGMRTNILWLLSGALLACALALTQTSKRRLLRKA
jgi:ABC-2 type transport system permease protein